MRNENELHECSATVTELFKALSKAQSKIEGAVKDSTNPHFRSSYADLESVWSAIRKQLADNGLSVAQLVTTIKTETGHMMAVKTVLGHSSGEYISTVSPINPVKADPQGVGSAITYMRRYALAAIVGVYQTDDDANSASSVGAYNGPTVQPKSKGVPNVTPEDAKKEKTKQLDTAKRAELLEAAKTMNWKPAEIQELSRYMTGKEIVELTGAEFAKIVEVIKVCEPAKTLLEAKEMFDARQ